jgi:hypothetical protein
MPYEKYQRLTSKSTSQQNAMDDVTEGGGCKTPIEENTQIGTTGSSGQALRQTSENEHFHLSRDKTDLDHSVTFYGYFQNIMYCYIVFVRFKKMCKLKKPIVFVYMVYCVTSP